MFGRATIRLGIGPHSSTVCCAIQYCTVSQQRIFNNLDAQPCLGFRICTNDSQLPVELEQ